MFDVLLARCKQGHRTMRYPVGPPPELPERFVGRPTVDASKCLPDCRRCTTVCPTAAVTSGENGDRVAIDLGRCLFCGQCQTACQTGAIAFSRNHQLAASARGDLVIGAMPTLAVDMHSHESAASPRERGHGAPTAVTLDKARRRLFGRSLKLRQVSAGGCNACEADTNVLGTIGWDLSRFGIQFVASPRHADGLLITGPVSNNMRLALQKTYDAVPAPKLVIVVGTCAISGGPYADHPEVNSGVGDLLPVDLFIPGCPPHPITILDGLLSLLGRN